MGTSNLKKGGKRLLGIMRYLAAFAVDSIRQWWLTHGGKHYGQARDLLILADAGGSNGYRLRCFKTQLQDRIADAFGLKVTVCHFPVGGQDARAENCCLRVFEVYG